MKSSFALILALCVAVSSVAGETPFSFRGISLGDTDQVALAKLRKELSAMSAETGGHPYRRFTAGDPIGVANNHCQAEAPARERLDCLWVQVSVLPDGDVDKVRLIDVVQSFRVAIPQNAFIERIIKTYGSPRSTHIPAKAPGIYSSGTYLWGGREARTKPFYMLNLPHEDMLAFGDFFVLLQLSGSGTDVTGYQLRIADSEAFFQFGMTRAEKYRAEVERAKKETLDGLKF